MITEITDAQRGAMAIHAQKWIDRVLEVRPADRALMRLGGASKQQR